MTEHEIRVDYDVIWTAGEGRRAYALAGGTPDPWLDKRTDLFVGWACTCGADGIDKETLGEHTRSILDDGQGYELTIDRRGE